ncbi:MAG: hypothetical protein K6F94_04140 [Bacteroidaceae bacterium]|nr:hypothetical protein [Bacteroidaceae bacterium]
MKRKEYIAPQLEVLQTLPTEIIASSGDQINISANDPDDEVDAGEALVRSNNSYSVWDDQWQDETPEQ